MLRVVRCRGVMPIDGCGGQHTARACVHNKLGEEMNSQVVKHKRAYYYEGLNGRFSSPALFGRR
eukprot:1022265-Prorocentrum_minimum.AAC.1